MSISGKGTTMNSVYIDTWMFTLALFAVMLQRKITKLESFQLNKEFYCVLFTFPEFVMFANKVGFCVAESKVDRNKRKCVLFWEFFSQKVSHCQSLKDKVGSMTTKWSNDSWLFLFHWFLIFHFYESWNFFFCVRMWTSFILWHHLTLKWVPLENHSIILFYIIHAWINLKISIQIFGRAFIQ